MSDIIKVTGEIIGYASGALLLYLLYFLQNKLKKKHPDTIRKADVETYRSVYEQLSLLMITGADRVYILEFHNGTDFSSSTLHWKLNCTYELVRNGISRMQERLQNIKASSIADYIHTFYSDRDEQLLPGVKRADACALCTSCKRECTYTFDIENMNEDLLAAELDMQGIKGMFQVGIRNSKKGLVGILGIDFCKSEHWKAVQGDEFDIPHTLKETAMRISRIWEGKK